MKKCRSGGRKSTIFIVITRKLKFYNDAKCTTIILSIRCALFRSFVYKFTARFLLLCEIFKNTSWP